MNPIPLPKFRTATSVMGINATTLMWSLGVTAPVFYVLSLFLAGLPWLIASALLYWFVGLRAAEWLLEIIPPKYFVHLMEWWRVGSALYVTNDSSPLPLAIPEAREAAPLTRPAVRA